MNIVLMNPPWEGYRAPFRGSLVPLQPLDLAYVAGNLRAAHDVRIIDMNAAGLTRDRLPDLGDPDLFMVTTAPSYLYWRCAPVDYSPASDLLAWIARAYPRAVRVVIGPHGSAFPEPFLRSGQARYVVMGEPEQPCLDLVEALARGEDPAGRPGIAGMDGEKVLNPGHYQLDTLDRLPFPAYDLLDMDHYRPHGVPKGMSSAAPVLTEASRGCSYQCIFCNKVTFRDKYRVRTPALVARDLARMRDEHGTDYAYFIDENFGINRKWLRETLEALKPVKVDWGCETHFNVLRPEDVPLMREAGCVRVEFGFESASEPVLETIRKGLSLEKVRPVLEACRKAGITPWLFCMIGAPGETKEDNDRTLAFLATLRDCGIAAENISVYPMIPYPKTEFWRIGVEKGILKGDGWEEVGRHIGTIDNAFDAETIEKERRRFRRAVGIEQPVPLMTRVRKKIGRLLGARPSTPRA
jgi:anaerobic magnesium-protoporphyrin IX monomethyl ester cyclase